MVTGPRRTALTAAGALLLVALGAGASLWLVPSAAQGGTDSTTTTLADSSTTTTTTTTTVTLTAAGDMMLGYQGSLPSNPASLLNPVRAILRAPIQFANLEGTLSNGGPSKCGANSTACYAFRAPPSEAQVYADAGFTVLNSANNHSHDFGQEGVNSTSAALRQAGIAQTGLPGQIAVVSENGVRVAFVGFAPYSNTNDFLNLPAAAALLRRAHHLADLVVVYMHVGAEGASATHVTRQTETFYGENRGNPYFFAHFVVDRGANLVLASGPHVLRGMEWYHHTLIDYSLGDFVNYRNFDTFGTLGLTGVLRVTLNSDGTFGSGSFTSLTLNASGTAYPDARDQSAHLVDTLSRQDFGASAAIIRGDGSIAPEN